MNSAKILINPHLESAGEHPVTIPVFVPELAEVRRFAYALHQLGRAWEGEMWGWPAEYQPELNLESVEIEEYDSAGNRSVSVGPFWSPAAFMLGESGVWFYSLSWERGSEEEPVEFVDDRNLIPQSNWLIEVDTAQVLHETGSEYRTSRD